MAQRVSWQDGTVLSTKLRPPTLPPDFVSRTRIHERLDQGIGRRLTLVCAPAGYGKSIAMAGWLQEARRPWAWVNLDELDSDLTSFTRVLVSALETIAPSAGRQALSVLLQAECPSPSQLSALLADDLVRIGESLVIVLDDYHLIQEPSIHALLSLLLRRLAPSIQLVIASREEPPLPSAVLRGRRELVEIRTDDLRFDRTETITFMQSVSSASRNDGFVADAVDQAEGWAVGLRLLTLISAPSESSPAGPTALTARDRKFVDAYLLDEVLDRQRPELQQFLMQVSILNRFCAPLCEAVLDGLEPGDTQRLLDEILAAGLFLTSLDDEQRWYRFHDLFRDMLRRRLGRQADPESFRALRLRASDWLAGQKLWDEAAAQAIDANDVGRVISLVESCMLIERSLGTGLMLESWIRRLPRDVVQTSPVLLLALFARLAIQGEVGTLESRLRWIEGVIDAEPSWVSPALLPIARGQIDTQLAWVLHVRGGADREACTRLERALDLLPMDQYDFRGGAAMVYALTLQCLGRTDDALASIGAELGSGTALHPDYVARLLTGQGYVELASGRLAAAIHSGRQMVAFTNAHDRPLMLGWGHYLLGRVAYEWNDLDDAREHFGAAIALGQDAHRLCSLNAKLGLAKTLIAQGQPAEAERLVRAELEQAEEDLNTFVVEIVRSFMARLTLTSGDPDRAADWLAGVAFTRQGIAAFEIEDPLLTRVQILLSMATSEGLDEASAAVDRAIEVAEARHVIASLVQGLALRAVTERLRGEARNAFTSITRALEIGAPGRFTRTFIDLGPALTSLLVELASQGRLPKEAERVLAACRAEAGVKPSSVPDRREAEPDDVVSLTWRELDVLQLMDGHHTNKEIARLLSISEETVKTHAGNIYGKLQVRTRREAVIRAYALGLLHVEDRRLPTLV